MTDDEFDRKSEAEFNRTFHGGRKAALARLGRMVRLASERLPTAKLNWISVHMAIHMDAEEARRSGTVHSGLSRQIEEEIESEQAPARRKVAVMRRSQPRSG